MSVPSSGFKSVEAIGRIRQAPSLQVERAQAITISLMNASDHSTGTGACCL